MERARTSGEDTGGCDCALAVPLNVPLKERARETTIKAKIVFIDITDSEELKLDALGWRQALESPMAL